MPSLLSRFKRSPSVSSSQSDQDRPRRSSVASQPDRSLRESTVSSDVILSEDESTSTDHIALGAGSPLKGNGHSKFVENFDQITQPGNTTPSPNKSRPPPLQVPASISKANVSGTPKLVLTEEGSNSPRSFDSSPVLSSPAVSQAPEGTGLGPGSASISAGSSVSDSAILEDNQTPTVNDSHQQRASMSAATPTTSPSGVHLGADAHDRSQSITSNGRHSRSGSIVKRISGKHDEPGSPGLVPVTSRGSTSSKPGKKKRDKKRAFSGSSGGGHSIAAALAKSGLHIANPSGDEAQSIVSGKRSSTNRSPWLVRGKDISDDSSLRGDDDDTYTQEDTYDYDDDEVDDSDSEYGEHLPVSGFALASNKRNMDFHALFPSVEEGDQLIEDYGCALAKDILVQGRLYVSENHICFHANIFGWVTNVVVAFSDIRSIEKKMTALVIPNAIGISTRKDKYTFASLLSRDATYDVMMNIWRLCNPDAVMSTTSFQLTNGSRPASVNGDDPQTAKARDGSGGGEGGGKGHAATQCACGKSGDHYAETALEATFPSSPEKIYNLMFNSGWYKEFLSNNQKLRDIESSDWKPSQEGEKNLSRSISYIKPLNGSIGPKQTKCHIIDEQIHVDYENYVVMLTTTKTPDVPSGGVFSVKTKSCFMWAGPNSTKVIVTTVVEWTGKSWVKGIIEKSAIEGQKTYHDDLEQGMRAYIKEHSSEFYDPDAGPEEVPAEGEGEVVGAGGETKEPTPAQAYAADTKKRQESHDNPWYYMAGAFDTIVAGLGSIGSGLMNLGESVADLVGPLDLDAKTVMSVLVVLLLISNIYTYVAYSSAAKQSSAARRIKRLGYKGDELRELVMDVLAKEGIKASGGGSHQLVPRHEVKELKRLLDEVESRVHLLRDVVEQQKSLEDLD
ncbi:hypothetical protein BCR39DRAFT_188949 [Naematelia encephala]|uniref:VASt domain-containing protein n=1 Tax=Naematelia encephala TaxID=71784 RepID=A0A1Y2BI04_9TREE|nr:hypothetical protein BCR39DRAFT_188949 [Naematelia encephala]